MKLVLVDVDFTLYPRGTGPFSKVNDRIEDYVMSALGLSRDEARMLRKEYIRDFGSTLGGMMRYHNTDPHDFIMDVHDVPVEDLLEPDARLQEALSRVRLPMVAFSNGSRPYVERILKALGVLQFFTEIFSIEDMDFIPKPLASPFEKILEKCGHSPFELILADDRADNIETAASMGMHGILVGPGADAGAEIFIQSIYELPDAVERLMSQYAPGRQ